MICGKCRNIPLALFEQEGYTYTLHPSKRALEDSAKRGCHSCAIFKESTTTWWRRRGHLVWGAEHDWDTIMLKNHGPLIAVTWGTRSSAARFAASNGVGCFIDGLVCKEVTDCIEPPLNSIPMLEADSPPNIEIMKKWLNDCAANHEACGVSLGKDLPTRLIDVQAPDISSGIRLVNGQDLSLETIEYMTLSHCWGATAKEAPWKLTTENENGFWNEISLDMLPKTFIDAINIVRSLNKRYLWIDSLCILQDEEWDWKIESARMNEIYRNSLCTLVSGSSSSTSGLFKKRNHLETSPAIINACGGTGQKSRAVKIWRKFQNRQELTRDVPVASRAWCLQERLFSRRLIQFTDHQIVWDCRTYGSSELLERANCEVLSHPISIFPTRRVLHHITPEMITKDVYKTWTWQAWYGVVRQFNTRSLTYPTDKLPAIKGVAQELGIVFRTGYFSGIWESDVIRGLLWYSAYPGRHANVYVAPSWSWASITANLGSPLPLKGLHNWQESLQQGLSEFKYCRVHFHTLAQYKIVLDGPLKTTTYRNFTRPSSEICTRYEFADDLGTGDSCNQTYCKPNDTENRDGEIIFDSIVAKASCESERVYLLPLFVWSLESLERPSNIAGTSCGLVLTEYESGETCWGMFRRVGYFQEVRASTFESCERERMVIL